MNERLSARAIAVLGLCAALLVAVQLALSFLPNIELVSLLIIIFSKKMGSKALFPIYVFALLECMIWGFHTWSLTYMYVWAVLFFIARMTSDSPAMLVAAVSGVYGLLFGTLCAIPYFFILGFQGGLATIVSGLMFDLAHGAGNFVAAVLLYTPLSAAFEKACPRELLLRGKM